MPQAAPRPDTHHWPHASQVSSAEPIREDLGLGPELLAWWALRRAHRGGVVKSGGQYVDHGHLRLSYLTRTLDELTEAGLLALAEEDPGGLRRVSLTGTGHAHYAQLTTTPARVGPAAPEPPFPTKTPAGRWWSCPDPLIAPGGQPATTIPTPAPQ
jgi:hypothetical protein